MDHIASMTDSFVYEFRKVHRGRLHLCIISIELDMLPGSNSVLCDIDLVDRVPVRALISDAMAGIALFFRKHANELPNDGFRVYIKDIQSTTVDTYPDDGRVSSYMAMFKLIFSDKKEPELRYMTEGEVWYIGGQ